MKNPFFKEEKEWRICYCANLNSAFGTSNDYIENDLSLPNIRHYGRRNDVIPFIDLSFKECGTDAIKEIIIGPKCAARKRDIETYLRNNDINCIVKESNGTYR